MDWFNNTQYEVLAGDVRGLVDTLPKVDCVVTSPPYFKQRKYGGDEKEMGQEETVSEFIHRLVDVFSKIPLQPWGNIWVNFGDKRGNHGELLCIPEKFVVEMGTRGFFLVDKVVWAKEVVRVDGTTMGHCMIEPAPRRLNGNGWEPFYRFVLDANRAWSDTCAVNIPREHVEGTRYRSEAAMKCNTSIEGRRLTNAWGVPVSFKGKGHFASYPSALVERPIAMTCPEWVTEKGPRERVTKKVEYNEGKTSKRVFGQYSHVDAGMMTVEELAKKAGRQDSGRRYTPRHDVHVGWTLTEFPAIPGIVLDPFGGTGTTGEATLKLGRRFIGIELYSDIAERMRRRCAQTEVETT